MLPHFCNRQVLVIPFHWKGRGECECHDEVSGALVANIIGDVLDFVLKMKEKEWQVPLIA